MRTASYILLAIVTIFLVNVVLSFALPGYRNGLIEARTRLLGIAPRPTEILLQEKDNHLASSLDRIDESIRMLATSTGTVVKSTGTGTSVGSGTASTGTVVNSGVTVAPIAPPTSPDIPISGLFLAKILKEITPKKIDSTGIFDIHIFTKIDYTTYEDAKKKIKIYAFDQNYDTMLKNLKLVSAVYTINESDTFFENTFFLNPPKDDGIVRFVTTVENRAIGVEVPKRYYPTLKKSLLK